MIIARTSKITTFSATLTPTLSVREREKLTQSSLVGRDSVEPRGLYDVRSARQSLALPRELQKRAASSFSLWEKVRMRAQKQCLALLLGLVIVLTYFPGGRTIARTYGWFWKYFA